MAITAQIINLIDSELSAGLKAVAVKVNTTNFNTMKTEQAKATGNNSDPAPLYGVVNILIDDALPNTGAGSLKIVTDYVTTNEINGTLT